MMNYPPMKKIAREFALSGEAQLIINILDASNLERLIYSSPRNYWIWAYHWCAR